MFVKTLDPVDLQENKEAFQLIDEDDSGEIDAQECIKKFKSINQNKQIFEVSIEEQEVENFIRKVDLDETGKISYSQFLSATLTDFHFKEENIKALFDDLDNQHKGVLTKFSLFQTFTRATRKITIK